MRQHSILYNYYITMPRMNMQFYYGEKNLLRALDEAEFWKRQEAEHTAVILLVTPGLEKNYEDELNNYGLLFNKTHGMVSRFVESFVRSNGDVSKQMRIEILELLKQCIIQSTQFIAFLEDILEHSSAVKNSVSSQTVIHHIIRESQYFIGIDQLILRD